MISSLLGANIPPPPNIIFEHPVALIYHSRPATENTHTTGAQTWTPQKENNAERTDFYSQTNIL
jgi:hypothetical protein